MTLNYGLTAPQYLTGREQRYPWPLNKLGNFKAGIYTDNPLLRIEDFLPVKAGNKEFLIPLLPLKRDKTGFQTFNDTGLDVVG